MPVPNQTHVFQSALTQRSAWQICVQLLLRLSPFLPVFILYLATASSNLSITHDSIALRDDIVTGRLEFHPNYLLFTNFLWLLIAPLEILFTTVQSLQIIQAAAGALSLHIFYKLLVDRLSINSIYATGALLIATFSYGLWYYSIALEVYIFPLCLLLLSFYILSAERITITSITAAAVLHSLATLVHQSSILFSFVIVVCLLVTTEITVQERIRRFGLYVLVCYFGWWRIFDGRRLSGST